MCCLLLGNRYRQCYTFSAKFFLLRLFKTCSCYFRNMQEVINREYTIIRTEGKHNRKKGSMYIYFFYQNYETKDVLFFRYL
jgi:hypothetical protein